jgi:type IV pilus assembly protein PilM
MERVMAVKMMKGKLLPIGLDLGTTTVRMAQFSQIEGNYDLIAAASADIPAEKQADFRSRLGFCGSAIKGLLSTGRFVGRECVLGLPAEATFVQHVKIARTEPEQVTTAVLQEVQGKLPFSASGAEIRHIVVGEVGGEGGQRQQEVIVVAAARETVMASLVMARKAGLDVSGVNIESCAIVECFARLFRRTADQTRAILFVDIGHASTQVVISHGSQIVFARNVIIAGQKFNQEIAEKLGITPNEATGIRKQLANQDGGDVGVQELRACMSDRIDELVGELTQCLLYHESIFRAGTVERVIFLGGQAMDRHLCQSIAQRLNLPAQIGDPLVRMGNLHTGRSESGIDRRESQPEWAVSVGLSLGGGQTA